MSDHLPSGMAQRSTAAALACRLKAYSVVMSLAWLLSLANARHAPICHGACSAAGIHGCLKTEVGTQITHTLGKFDFTASVRGGGEMGQAQAVRHALTRALERWDPALRPPLKRAGFITHDPRMVERKKPGRKKARKAFQWVKR